MEVVGVEVQWWGIAVDLAFGVGAISVSRSVDRVLGRLVWEDNSHYTMMGIPRELVPAVRELISMHEAERESPIGVGDDVVTVGGGRGVRRVGGE